MIKQSKRKGAIAPLTAVLLVPILGMVAFSVDLGYIILAKTELQRTADAAALAGAQELIAGFNTWRITPSAGQAAAITTASNNAKTMAKNYASYNYAGGKAITLLDSDIELGYTNGSGTYSSTVPTGSFPNTIKVIARRDSTANEPVGLFFAPVLGTSSQAMTATARGTIYTGTINGFNAAFASANNLTAGILPVTFDVNTWDNFLTTHKDADGNINTAADGTYQLQIYPSVKDTGNFGELSLNDSHNGASTISNWINFGVSAADLQSLANNNLIPLSNHNASLWDWNGNPGMKASTVIHMNLHEGKVYTLPLFKPYNSDSADYEAGTGNGSHYNYNIVRFVTVKIMPASKINQQLVVQPAPLVDSLHVFQSGTVVPAGTGSATVTTFATPKLTR